MEKFDIKYDPNLPHIDNIREKIADHHRMQMKKDEKRAFLGFTSFMHRINLVQRIFMFFMTMIVSTVYEPETDEENMSEYETSSAQHQQ